MYIYTRLQKSWLKLLEDIGVGKMWASDTFVQIQNQYTSSHRFYHTLIHIDDVLNIIEDLQLYGQDLVSLRLAAWFHDVIYDSQATDNEAKSAELASELLEKLSIANSIIQRVRELILLTQSHQVIETDIDGKILLDADLSILGSHWSKYWQYAQNIRQEYAWVNDRDYSTARINVLHQFLGRSQIYFYLYDREDTARWNIQREIELLHNDRISLS